MSRSKLIILIALILAAILAVAFAMQVKRLQKQIRSSTRLIPGESKSREDLARQELEQGPRPARPDVLVRFRAGVSAESVKRILAYLNDQSLDEIEAVPGLMAIDDRDDADAETTAGQYRSLAEVEYAEPNYDISLEPVLEPNPPDPADPSFNPNWLLPRIEVPQAWAKTRGSEKIVVAFLDSGVEYTHTSLATHIWVRPSEIKPYSDRDLGTIDDVHGFNALTNDGDPHDENGHGTSGAGVLCGACINDKGVCGIDPTTKFMPLKFLNAGGFGTVADAIEAINYAIDRKHAGVNIRVIGVGWGLTQSSRALGDVIRSAGQAGIFFVAAGGNQHENNDVKPYYPASYQLENVVSVAATTRDDSLAAFSNYGEKSIQLAAPGYNIRTTALGNDYQISSDTSLSAAIVSGVATLALSAKPNLSVSQLRKLLLNSVDKVPALSDKVSTGGRINAAKAVGAK